MTCVSLSVCCDPRVSFIRTIRESSLCPVIFRVGQSCMSTETRCFTRVCVTVGGRIPTGTGRHEVYRRRGAASRTYFRCTSPRQRSVTPSPPSPRERRRCVGLATTDIETPYVLQTKVVTGETTCTLSETQRMLLFFKASHTVHIWAEHKERSHRNRSKGPNDPVFSFRPLKR